MPSQNLKIKYDIDYIYHTYFIAPEKDEKYLIISLLMFITIIIREGICHYP